MSESQYESALAKSIPAPVTLGIIRPEPWAVIDEVKIPGDMFAALEEIERQTGQGTGSFIIDTVREKLQLQKTFTVAITEDGQPVGSYTMPDTTASKVRMAAALEHHGNIALYIEECVVVHTYKKLEGAR